MCVISYKPYNQAFPSKAILENCFNNNNDGAGFMYAYKGNVYIRKGFETFQAFYNALEKARKLTGDRVPYVMHFRIATQGHEKTMTHPFPLSSEMSNMYKLHNTCNIGIAHNGILKLTSDGAKDYSDTMKFITDYLSLIIRNYSWHNDTRTKELIERLIDGSRLAILDKNGHCELMGQGWVEDNGIFYSNNSYSYKKYSYPDAWDWPDYYGRARQKNNEKNKACRPVYWDPYHKYYNSKTGLYEFHNSNCPLTNDDDGSYCTVCKNYQSCLGYSNNINNDIY